MKLKSFIIVFFIFKIRSVTIEEFSFKTFLIFQYSYNSSNLVPIQNFASTGNLFTKTSLVISFLQVPRPMSRDDATNSFDRDVI